MIVTFDHLSRRQAVVVREDQFAYASLLRDTIELVYGYGSTPETNLGLRREPSTPNPAETRLR